MLDPARPPQSARLAQCRARDASNPVPIAQGRILFVEDDDEVAALVREMLAQLGYEVLRAASAAAALGALANERHVDLVFSDIMMPGGMSGLDLAREVRARRPGLPILLTSGYAEASIATAQAMGVSVLPKPYRLDQLAASLSACARASPQRSSSRSWVTGRATSAVAAYLIECPLPRKQAPTFGRRCSMLNSAMSRRWCSSKRQTC